MFTVAIPQVWCQQTLVVQPMQLGIANMSKQEHTSKSVGSKASKQLSNPKSTPAEKSVAGSALTQRPHHPAKRK